MIRAARMILTGDSPNGCGEAAPGWQPA